MAKLMITVLFLCLLLVPQAMPVLATPPDSMVTSNGGEQSHRAYEHIPSPRLLLLHLIIPVASGRRGGWPSCSPPMHPPFAAQACSLPHLKLACSPQACSLAHLKPEGCCLPSPRLPSSDHPRCFRPSRRLAFLLTSDASSLHCSSLLTSSPQARLLASSLLACSPQA
jgi:hypothetical protein